MDAASRIGDSAGGWNRRQDHRSGDPCLYRRSRWITAFNHNRFNNTRAFYAGRWNTHGSGFLLIQNLNKSPSISGSALSWIGFHYRKSSGNTFFKVRNLALRIDMRASNFKIAVAISFFRFLYFLHFLNRINAHCRSFFWSTTTKATIISFWLMLH